MWENASLATWTQWDEQRAGLGSSPGFVAWVGRSPSLSLRPPTSKTQPLDWSMGQQVSKVSTVLHSGVSAELPSQPVYQGPRLSLAHHRPQGQLPLALALLTCALQMASLLMSGRSRLGSADCGATRGGASAPQSVIVGRLLCMFW